MKKFFIVLLVIVSLFALCSCSLRDYVCYYAYFKDTAFMLIYSPEKNTLYEVNVPSDIISLWGKSENITSFPDAMRSFANLNESGFMIGIPQTLDAVKDILNAMSNQKDPTAEDRLGVLAERAADFSNPALLSKMNSLCGTDFTALVNALKNKQAKVNILDASSVVSNADPAFSQKYFKKFLTQVIYK